MRIALISMSGESAAAVRLAGRTLAWHQLLAALSLSCERIVCLADAPGPDLAALQREAERRGASFHAVAHHRTLSGLVSAADTLLVFAPGVLAEPEWLAQAFGARAGVAVLPAAGAVERGFERIDRDRAWAGVLATRGDAVEALVGLPPDADPIAGLLRVALQRGGTPIGVPDQWLDDGHWALVATQAAAERYQADWYGRNVPAPSLLLPAYALAHRAARAIFGRVRESGRLAAGLVAAGLALAIGAGAAGYLGQTTAAVAALTIAAMVSAIGMALGRFARAGTGDRTARWPDEVRRAAIDLALVATAASPREFEGWTAGFAALVLVVTIRLAEEPAAPKPLRPFGDRALILLALTGLAALGAFPLGMAALGLAGLCLRLFWPVARN